MEGMLHGALRLSDHPRARVVAIDVSEAATLPGVEHVFLAGEIPGDRHIGLIVPDWPVLVAEGETTRYVGDVLACVAATDRRRRRRARPPSSSGWSTKFWSRSPIRTAPSNRTHPRSTSPATASARRS